MKYLCFIAKTWILITKVLTVSRLIDLHLDRYFRRYSKSSSDLIVPARHGILLMKPLGSRSRGYKNTRALILPALEEINIIELAELEGELEGGL